MYSPNMKNCCFLACLLLAACSRTPPLQPALDSINSASLLGEIKTLASDEFEGRKPGSAGEQKTIAYMQQEFQQMGLKPGNPNGTYLQNVPLAGITSKPQTNISVKGKHLDLVSKK